MRLEKVRACVRVCVFVCCVRACSLRVRACSLSLSPPLCRAADTDTRQPPSPYNQKQRVPTKTQPNEQEALTAFRLAARDLVVLLQPCYDTLKECLKFQSRAERLLADLHSLLLPVTLHAAPLLMRSYMRLFANACRLVLLLRLAPRKELAQVYTIACHELVGRDPPGRRALCSYLAACDEPASLLQHRFLCVSQRVSQVLELVAAPALAHAGSAEALAASQVLDTFHSDAPGTMGVKGFSVDRTYQ